MGFMLRALGGLPAAPLPSLDHADERRTDRQQREHERGDHCQGAKV